MSRRLLILIFILVLMASSCTQESLPVELSESPPTVKPASTATDIPPTEEAAPAVDLGKVAGCTVRSPRPTPNPTLQAVLPPPGEDDWTRGPDNAYVTIIEYGDYQ